MLNRNFAIALAVAMVMAALYGCSSSGGIRDDRDMYKEEAEMLQGNLDTANEEVMRLTGELATANSDKVSLQTDLAAANDRVMELDGLLAAANDRVMELDGLLAAANSDKASLQTDLDAANDRVMELDGLLATANSDKVSLQTDLDTANDRVTELDGLLAAANGTIEDLRMQLASAGDNVGTLTSRVTDFETAANATDAAVKAGAKASEALGTATGSSVKLTTRTVAGDSRMAEANAQAVLDSRDHVNEAVMTAQGALDSAEAALAMDADPADALTKALNAAIAAAKANLTSATEIADGDALKTAVEAVTGADPELEDYPTTPADHGEMVAMDIGGALGPTNPTDDGSPLRVMHATAAPAEDVDNVVRMDNRIGRTWAEIVGMANIMQMRIANTVDDTDPVPAAPIAGQPRSSVDSGGTLTEAELADGAEHEGNYKGIPGTVFCAGSCATDGETLTGSWYFTPTSETEWYVRNEGDTAYEPETLYARFGHWLAANTDVAITDINTFAATMGNRTIVLTVDAEDDDLKDTSATYTGDAAGMSLHKEFDSQGMIMSGSLQSGAFTASVTLTATFGTDPTLGGEVTNFMYSDESMIDSRWSVELLNRGFTGGNFTDGTTVASGQDGVWTAQAFGATGNHPTGIFGGFNAHFTNGHVAGAYATRE